MSLEERIADAIALARGQQTSTKPPVKNRSLEATPGATHCAYCGGTNLVDWALEVYCRGCGQSAVKGMRTLRYVEDR